MVGNRFVVEVADTQALKATVTRLRNIEGVFDAYRVTPSRLSAAGADLARAMAVSSVARVQRGTTLPASLPGTTIFRSGFWPR